MFGPSYNYGIDFRYCTAYTERVIDRQSADLAKQLAAEFKIVAVVGPRQSGKTHAVSWTNIRMAR